MGSTKKIIVTGDVTVDWNLARVHRSKGKIQRWGYDDCTRATSQPGGAALLGNLIETLINNEEAIDYTLIQRELFQQTPIEPIDNRFHHSYVLVLGKPE